MLNISSDRSLQNCPSRKKDRQSCNMLVEEMLKNPLDVWLYDTRVTKPVLCLSREDLRLIRHVPRIRTRRGEITSRKLCRK